MGFIKRLRDAREKLASFFNLSEEDRSELLPSRTQSKFDNRVAWAKSYLIQAKALQSPKRAYFKITERGKNLLAQGHEKINIKVLDQYPEFVEFHKSSKQNKGPSPTPQTEENASETPEETLQKAYENIRSDLAGQILETVKNNSPSFFEKLVVDLMVAMGYGGSRADAGKSLGKSGDEGVDGIIKEDRLGLDVIFLQAKRWEGTVQRPEIQKFVGALYGKKAQKGVFITTSKFSEGAREYVENIEPKIILIDGRDLAEYMIDFNIGIYTVTSYELKRIDSDYFLEE